MTPICALNKFKLSSSLDLAAVLGDF